MPPPLIFRRKGGAQQPSPESRQTETLLPITAAILCGGQSRRMGLPKHTLPFHGQTLLERKLGQFSHCRELLVCGEGSFPAGARAVSDRYQDCGPMAGLHSALSAGKTPLVFCAACDMPFLDERAAAALLLLLGRQDDAVVPVLPDGRRLFVSALFRRRCLPGVTALLERGSLRLQGLGAVLALRQVPVEELPLPPETWCNVNTPAQLGQALLLRPGRQAEAPGQAKD